MVATYRLTRLIFKDTITERLRERILERMGPESKVSELITCPYCLSIWVGFGVLAARTVLPRPWQWAARGLTYASAGSFLVLLDGMMHEDKPPSRHEHSGTVWVNHADMTPRTLNSGPISVTGGSPRIDPITFMGGEHGG